MLSPTMQHRIKTVFKAPEERFINRELSWLAFNTRVLEEAENTLHPLLERLKFLSISARNLDEFYMVRVAGLFDMIENHSTEKSHDGLSPKEQLEKIYIETATLIQKQVQCWEQLKLELKKQRIEIWNGKNLEEQQKEWLETYFINNIFPAITPIAIDPAHPFPFLPNLGLAIVLKLHKKINVTKLKKGASKTKLHVRGKNLRAIIPLPAKLPRFIPLPQDAGKEGMRLMLLEDVMVLFQGKLFPGYEVDAAGLIRIIRDSELEITDAAEDLVRTFESAVKERRKGNVIRLEVEKKLPNDLHDFVVEELRIAKKDIADIEGMMSLASIAELYALDRPDLKFSELESRFPERINDFNGDCFAAIKAKDIVVHHPYESFDVVVRFLRQAAADPNVIAIKQTLYRTSDNSPIVKALVEAAEAGKSVTAVVELKARFDEEANLRWGRDLGRAGAQVIYGLAGLKTHTKISLVVRREGQGLQSYVHVGTGNYHPETARVYADLSFFTCEPALCRDAVLVFNYLTGYSPPRKLEKISIAPLGLRKRLLALIAEEKAHAEAGRPAAIWAKMNSLVDEIIIDALYEAAQAGVKIDLIVRGICCLRPGILGFSENIHVKSIVGRFLEHERVFCFGGGVGLPSPQAKVFISAADWMQRNLDRRVEVMVPIENPTVHEQIMGQIMVANIKDKKQSWVLGVDGKYTRVAFTENDFSAHEYFLHNPSLSGRGKALKDKRNLPSSLI